MNWTDERVALLRKFHAEGYSGSQIAGLLGGVTRNAVIGKLHRLGIRRCHASAPALAPKRAVSKSIINAATGFARRRANTRSPKLPKPEPTPMSKPVLLSGQEKVWTERGRFECNWIVAGEGADSLACCAKVHARGWCAFHYQRGTLKPEPAPRRKRVVREPTFYDVEAA